VKIRRATVDDARTVAQLLHDFNAEYDQETPGIEAIAARMAELLPGDDFEVLLAGDGPDGFALVRFRPSYWLPADEAHLGELYVVPPLRGRGVGCALLAAAIEMARERGCTHVDLNTSVDDVAARRLYERTGFTNREGRPDGPSMLYYERDLRDASAGQYGT
jgi:ribosomal protein S18 acetylase RimI-like enzyme